ncbi:MULTISPECIES: sterol desaturase family protein [Amycolatopsis]|uniref:Sterol desaturase family protein n=1 Tax=Amycolatopsis albidoflavus TaxID=102226 RepID=A0ABW5IAT4_9PSEU
MSSTGRARTLLRYGLPYLFVLVFPAFGVLAVAGGSSVGVYAVYAAVAGTGLIAERLIPFVSVPRVRYRSQLWTDVLYLVTSPALYYGIQLLLLPGMQHVRDLLLGHWRIWPAAWPVALQVVLALLVVEFGYYWIHRLNHGDNIFWRSHRVHHSPENLDWLMGWRLHWLDEIMHHVAARSVPLILLGVPAPVVAVVMVVISTHSMFPHLNADVVSGRLFNLLVDTPELHRWHHLKDPKLAQVNFGGTIAVWDLVFGTYQRPGVTPDVLLGIPARHQLPESWTSQILAPWRGPKLVPATSATDRAGVGAANREAA